MTKKLPGELFSKPVVSVYGSYNGSDEYYEEAQETNTRLHFLPGGEVRWTDDTDRGATPEPETVLVSELDEDFEDYL